MSLLGVYGQPSISLDSHIDVTHFHTLYDEMAMGIAKSWVDKGVVSCGTRENETHLELCHVLQKPEKYLTDTQISCLEKLTNLHQKAWYVSLILPVHHPYSLVFLRREQDFWRKQYADNCKWTENAKYFPETIRFIESLPFQEIGRILFFITEPENETLIHYDGGSPEARQKTNTEMIYFRPGLKKKIFIWDEDKQLRYPITSCASYWNDLDWHGTDPTPGKSFSLRIDGIFKAEFRDKLRLSTTI